MGLNIVIVMDFLWPNVSAMAVCAESNMGDLTMRGVDYLDNVCCGAELSTMTLCTEFIILWRLYPVTFKPCGIMRRRQQGHIHTHAQVTGCAILFGHLVTLKTDFHARLIPISNGFAQRNRQMAGCAHNFRAPLKL
jgi:hypothetical protein